MSGKVKINGASDEMLASAAEQFGGKVRLTEPMLIICYPPLQNSWKAM